MKFDTVNNNSSFQENLWGYAKRLRFVEDAISKRWADRPAREVRILDVGCGNGSQFAIPLAHRGFDITGIDIDARSIEHARQLTKNSENVRFLLVSVQDQALSSFDVVVLSEVLEHLRDPEALLGASLRFLRPDGLVIVTVPNGYGEFEIDSWLFRTLRLQSLVDRLLKNDEPYETSTNNVDCGHLQFFTRGRIKQLFRNLSLSVIQEGVGSFLSGPFIGFTLARYRRFIEWNASFADRLPAFLASSWYFALHRTPEASPVER